MAEGTSPPAKALERVNELLKCPICLDSFNQPKFLPCIHAFCQDCLSGLPLKKCGDCYTLNCPVCCRPAQLPGGCIRNFPNAYHVPDLKEIQTLMKKKPTGDSGLVCYNCEGELASNFCQQCQRLLCQECVERHRRYSESPNGNEIVSIKDMTAEESQLKMLQGVTPSLDCPKHKSDLKIYCSDCDELICHDCIVRDHRNHNCDPISDEAVFKKHKETIDSNLQNLKNKLAFITEKIKSFEKRMTEISENRDRIKQEIRATGDQMIAEYIVTVRESVGELQEKADRGAEQKMTFVNAQMRDAQKTAAVLQRCVEYMEGELRMCSQQQILAGKRQMVEKLKVVTSQVNEEEYSTTEEADMQFKKKSKNTMVGTVDFSLVVHRCKVSRKHRTDEQVFNLTITHGSTKKPSTYPTALFSCKLFVPPGPTPCPIDYSVETISPGKYTIAFTSVTCGPHQFKVMLGDIEIPGIPSSIWIHTRHATTYVPQGSAFFPCLSVSVGRESIVTANEKSIHVLNKQGEKTDRIKSGWSKSTRFEADSITITQDDAHILFTSFTSHYIKKLNLADQKITDTIGSHGTDPLQFDHPSGIHVHPNGTILVADTGNHRIQVLNPDLSFSHMLGSGRCSSKHGEFNEPTDITTDFSGMVYVADKGNQRVQKLTLKGDFVTQFYTVDPPRNVTFDRRVKAVYVLCSEQLFEYAVIQVFNTSGIFLGNIFSQYCDINEIISLNAMAVDASTGTLFIASNGFKMYKITDLLDQLPFL